MEEDEGMHREIFEDTKNGILASIWEWRVDRSLHIHLCGRFGNAQRPANQARGVGCSHYSGHVKLSWANLGVLEATQREAHEQSQAHTRLDGHAR